MKCPTEDKYFIVDFENDQGMKGCLGMDKGLYDEEDLADLVYTLSRVISSWSRRRQFEHEHPELYYKIC